MSDMSNPRRLDDPRGMSPSEHFYAAEQLLHLGIGVQTSEVERFHLAAAQVHATLATVPLAAAYPGEAP